MSKSEYNNATKCQRCATHEQSLITRYDELAVLQKLYIRLEANNLQLVDLLNKECAARKKIETQLVHLRTSTSWRLTAPLRALIRRVRR